MNKIHAVIALAVFSLFITGCSDSGNPAPTWSATDVAKYVTDNSDLSNVKITKDADQTGLYSGTAEFNGKEMLCSVTIEKNRISWEAKTDPVEKLGADGSRSVTGGETVAGSRTW